MTGFEGLHETEDIGTMGAFLTNDLPQFEPATGFCAWRLSNCTNGWGIMVYRARAQFGIDR